MRDGDGEKEHRTHLHSIFSTMTVIPKSEESTFQVSTQHSNAQFEFERKKTNKCRIKDSGCVIVDQKKKKMKIE